MFVRTKIQFFESKSQQWIAITGKMASCSSEQRYNFLKANHNSKISALMSHIVVRQNKDTIFWKQITTHNLSKLYNHRCSSEQRYNFLKANHNIICAIITLRFVVRQNKDTIFWKQITTRHSIVCHGCQLFVRTKIQFFESKSQLTWNRLYLN